MATYTVYNTESSKTIGANDVMFVYGWAFSCTIQNGGSMSILSSGRAVGSGTWNTINNGGVMIVGSKGIANSTEINNGGMMIVSGNNALATMTNVKNLGSMVVSDYGSASAARVGAGGKMFVSSRGSAYDCSVYGGGSMTVLSNGCVSKCYVTNAGSMTVSSGGRVSSAIVSGNGRLDLASGSAFHASIGSGGFLYISSGGWTLDTTVSNDGRVIILKSGSDLGTEVYSGGKLYVSSEAEANVDTVFSGGTMVVSKGGSAIATTVSSGGSMVLYGDADDLTVKKGSVIIKNGATVTSLTNKGGDISLEKGAVVMDYKGDPIKMPDCDIGDNNYLYDKKAKDPVNSNVIYYGGTKKIAANTTAIVLDTGISVNGYSNYIGFGDETDFVKISLDHAAKVSFNLKGTGAMKFTVWSFTISSDKNEKTTYSMKSLQATTAKYDKVTKTYKATTKGLLLDKGDYYISMQSTNAKKGGNSYYNVTLNPPSNLDGTYFFDNAKSNNNDDWDDMKTKGASGKVVNLGQISANTSLLLNDWVGFGDAVDYREFTVKSDAKVRFSLQSTGAAKFAIYKLVSKTDRKGVTTYSLKQILSKSFKPKEDFVETKLLQLDAGENYYFSVQSTDAKKGGEANYYIYLYDYEPIPYGKYADALAGPEETGGSSADDALSDAMNAFAAADFLQDAPLAAAGFLSLDSVQEKMFADSSGGILAGL